MTSHSVKLYCSNCGSQLEVYNDMERLFCGNCGTGMEVQRQGGTVALAVTESNKTTADVPLTRLRQEQQELSTRRQAILDEGAQKKQLGFIIGAALIAIGMLSAASGRIAMGFVFFAVGIVAVKFVRTSSKKVQAQALEIQAKLDLLERLEQGK